MKIGEAIFHITHSRNLPQILKEGRLWCDRERLIRKLETTGIAHNRLKERRARWSVPIGNGGHLSDYVPFYFAPRSPMLYSIHKGNVEGYDEGQSEIIHLVGSLEEISKSGLPFVFSDGHAVMKLSKFYNDLNNLDEIDWETMKAKFWADTDEDGDRERRRNAEFLIYNEFPVELCCGIGVYSREVSDRVKQILQGNKIEIPVRVIRNWYY